MKNIIVRKMAATVLALCMGLAVFPLSAYTVLADTGESPTSDFEWRYMGETIQLKKYVGKGGAVIIPAVYEGLPVVSIASDAFYNRRNVKSVVIPDGVTEIGSRAFCECSLADIVIPDSVTSIAYGCFQESALTSVILPKGLKSIEKYLFMDCKKLVSVVIPGSVTEIRESAFEGAESLLDITVPGSVTETGKRAFYGCATLRNVIFGDGVSFIRDYAFQKCNKLVSMYVPDSVTSIGILTFDGFPPVTLYIHEGSYAEYYVKTFAAAMRIPYRYIDPLVPSAITSGTYTLRNGRVTVPAGTSAAALAEGMNEHDFIRVYRNGQEAGDEEKAGTGMTVQLMDGGLIKQSVTVVIRGDVGGDGDITASDALLVLQQATGKIQLAAAPMQAAMTAGKGTVSASDALLILQFATAKISEFPVAG